MKYMGSKSRIVKEIAPIIQSYIDSAPKRIYYEPFCGGCNVIDHISANKKIAADNHKYLIALYQNLHRMNELPSFVTKNHYDSVRACYNKGTNQYEDWYVGAIGFLASYNGRFFDGGYAGVRKTKTGIMRDYYAEAKRNLEAQIPAFDGIEFRCLDYRATEDVSGCVIYCDPPYEGKKQYSNSKGFDHGEFWNWVRDKSENNIVLVSELEAPNDFKCIWERQIVRNIDYSKRIKSSEKLYIRR